MKTIACYKVSPDNQDISVLPDRSISFDRAQNVLGEYDLVAIEEAVRLAEQTGGRLHVAERRRLQARGFEAREGRVVARRGGPHMRRR